MEGVYVEMCFAGAEWLDVTDVNILHSICISGSSELHTKCLFADPNVSYSIVMLKQIQACMWSLHLASSREKKPKKTHHRKKGKNPLRSLFIDNFLYSLY